MLSEGCGPTPSGKLSYVHWDWSLSLLQLVVEHEYSATYAYYKVPSPWLQVKLLKLLQYYPPSGSSRRITVSTQCLIVM